MALIQSNSPADRKKLIAAVGLGVVALAVLSYALFGSSGGSSAPVKGSAQTKPTQTAQGKPEPLPPDPGILTPIPTSSTVDPGSEAKRNIFAFYVPPATPVPTVPVPLPAPTPTPPRLLASLSPANVYARTGDFTME